MYNKMPGSTRPNRRTRRADADGVPQRDFVAAHVKERLGHARGVRGGHRALVGAAQYARDVAPHAHAPGLGGLHHGAEALQTLGDAVGLDDT